MKRILYILCLCPALLMAQPKADWTFYGPSFGYQQGELVKQGYATVGLLDLAFTQDGTMILSSVDAPIIFFKNGKDYTSRNIMFEKEGPKEGSKVSIIKGAQTADAVTMLVDKKKDLWFGNNKGLHRIEADLYADLAKMEQTPFPLLKGTKFTDETPGMPFSSITQILEDKAGNIWVSGAKLQGLVKVEHKGISKFDGTQWTNLLVTGQEDKPVTYLILDTQNNPVVVSQSTLMQSTVSWYKDSQWKSLGNPEKNWSVGGIACDKNNTLYAASTTDLYVWKNDQWSKVVLKNLLSGINDLKIDKTNNVWIATSYGITCLTPAGSEYQLKASNSPIPSDAVRKLIIDEQNKKWFFTEAGLVGFKEPEDVSNENMTVFTKFNSGLADGKIESMASYKAGFIMVNNDNGLFAYDGKSITKLTTESELSYNDVAVDKNNVVYVGTYRFIHKYDGSSYTKWTWKDDIGKQVTTILIDNQDKVWIGFDGVSKFDGTVWQNFNKKNAGLSSNSVVSLFQDSKSNIWATLYDGIAKYDGTAWTVYTKKTAGVALGNMKGIAETKDGKMLFSNGYSLIEFDGTAMKEVPGFKKAGTLRNMIIDEDGTLLIATEENGIAKFKDGALSFCNENMNKIPSNSVNYIFKDSNGKLWASCGQKYSSGFTPMTSTTEAPQETPQQIFTKKVKEFDSFFSLVQLKKY